jgi:hypothetical protein
MVAYGYILPKKNQDTRAETLQLGLKNQNVKNLNAKIRIEKTEEIVKNRDVVSLSTQTEGDPLSLTDLAKKTTITVDTADLYENLSELEKKRGSEISSVPVLTSDISQASQASQNLTPEERALKSAIEAKKLELKRELTDQEKSDISSKISQTKSLLSEISTGSKQSATSTATTQAQTIAEFEAELAEKYKDVGLSETAIKKEIKNLNFNKNQEFLIKEVKSGKTVYYANAPNQRKINQNYKLTYNDASGKLETIDGKELPKSSYKKTLEWVMMPQLGTGIRGGAVKSPYYSSYAPNFGNLYLKEDSLKKNQLTIYKPYSKVSVASKSSITPLLKKMILDIQNTLEFDERDYQNLEADEKRVIERIIRGQKNMKNYNIQALIDADDLKAKKRLEILVGQINAGNNSSLIRQEMKALLKRLYDNKAISMWKYQNSLKAIKALE